VNELIRKDKQRHQTLIQDQNLAIYREDKEKGEKKECKGRRGEQTNKP
jgi:hypothetical protein